MVFGIAVALPGQIQSSTRSEVYALVFAVAITWHEVPLAAVTDNEATANTFNVLKARGFQKSNLDMMDADLGT